ncbi:MAG: hypothetical protein ACQESH_00735 [Campylobacterota bacterium]
MKHTALIGAVAAILFLSGCSSKKVYEPRQIDSKLSSYSCEKIVNLTADGATLQDATYISKSSQGEVPQGFIFLNDTHEPIFADKKGLVKVGDKQIDLQERVVSASVYAGELLFVTSSNRYGIYDLEKDEIRYQNMQNEVSMINTRTVAPIKIDNLYVFATLNGKLMVVSNNEIVREITITTQAPFNNIIFLNVLHDTLIAATASDIIALGGKSLQRHSEAIADIVLDNTYIYLFTKDGKFLQLEDDLTVRSKQSFQFANFIWASTYEGTIYAVEKSGYVLSFDDSLTPSIHKLKDDISSYSFLKDNIFISGGRCYKL